MRHRMVRMLGAATLIAPLVLLFATAAAFAQDSIPTLDEPTAAALAGVAGVTAFVTLITNILRGTMPADVFDRWGSTIAVVVGIVLALIGVFVNEGPRGADAIVTAILVGLTAGWLSQNANAQVKAALGKSSTPAGQTPVP